MAKQKSQSDQEQVANHINQLDPKIKPVVEFIREVILKTNPLIGERIKWNNPSFYYTGEMKASDPKEYKREIAVFNLYKNRLMLVFPHGVKLKDPSKLLEGEYADGRRLIIFKDMTDAKEKANALEALINSWFLTLDK